MGLHEKILELFEAYCIEAYKFDHKNVKRSVPRARKALKELALVAKQRMAEMSKELNAIRDDGKGTYVD